MGRRGGGRGDGGREEVEVGEVREAVGQAVRDEAPVPHGEATAQAPGEARPPPADQRGGPREVRLRIQACRKQPSPSRDRGR